MNTLPLAWLHMINKLKGKSCDCHVRPYTCTPFVTLLSASCVISSSRALSGCVSLAQHRELRDLKLDGVRMLLLDDGANPCMFMRYCTIHHNYDNYTSNRNIIPLIM